jgi:3-deoxy-D-manno-octulosonic-acid transferase
MWLLYQLGMGAALLLAGPYLWWRRRRHYATSLLGRLGGGPAGSRGATLWFHAVSVGEVGVAAAVARALPAGVPLLVTTVTPTGQERARALLGDRADIAYLPLDLGFAIRRFFRRHRPAALVLVEGDYWPLLLSQARRRELPVRVINGRVSDRTFPRLRRIRRWLDPFFAPVERFGVQTDVDRDRLQALGVPAERIEVTGNLKYEIAAPEASPGARAWLASAQAHVPGRPVWVVGSTMSGEEDPLLDGWEASGRAHLPVLAPRHPDRWDEVAGRLAERGLRCARRSQGPLTQPADVLLLDSLGELAGLYGEGQAAFVGGTLVPTGGHNPLEPAAHAVPVAVGPHMDNFREMAEAFDTAGAWRRVGSASDLGAVLREWANHPEAARTLGHRGRELIQRHRGALQRTLRLLEPLLVASKGRGA